MEQRTFLRELALTRRGFFTGMAAGCAVPGSTWRPRDDVDDMAAAQRLAGLAFSDADLKIAARRVASARAGFAELRRRAVDWWTAPAWNFDPLPPGVAAPSSEPQPKFALPAGATAKDDADLAYASVAELAGLLRARKVTSRRLTELCIARLKQHDAKLLCVVTLLEKAALAAADRADAEIAADKWRGPLHGIPYGAKDLFAWPGAPTTFGAAPFRDQVLDLRSTVLAQLERSGAVLVAKLSLGALAMGDVWFGGRTRNPWNPEQGSSGSSAGPASAVAAGLLPFAIGTETLGSIVSPCTRCGVAGLRPTFGLVSRYGAMPLSWSMDKVGPIARNAIDLAIVFDAIRGPDGKDTMMRAAGFAWPVTKPLDGLRVGLVAGTGRGRRGDTADAWQRGPEGEFVGWLREQGAGTVPIVLPDVPYGALRQILSVEAATAFDDLTRSDDLQRLTRQDPGAWPHTFRAARFVPAVEYLRATRVRTQLLLEMHATMQRCDVLLAARSSAALTCTNLTGHPTVVFPYAKGRGRTPASMSIIGQLYGESAILAIADAWQRKTEWHRGRPL